MKVAVVGCGYWGSKHVRVLHGLREVEHVVAVDQREDRLLRLRESFPGLEIHRSLESALDRVDAVIVATPPRTHASIALQAMAAGKSVLVEKPLATETAQVHAMMAEAAARSVVLMVGHTFEYNGAVWKLRDLVQQDELGRVYYMDSARLNLGLYQSDVNVIWDLAPHDVSIFNYILGSTPVAVQAWASRHVHPFLEDVAYLRLWYRDPDVAANIHVSWLDPCKVRRVTVVGSSKMAVYNDLSEERIRIFDKGVLVPDGSRPQDTPVSYRYGDILAPYFTFEEPLAAQDREFVCCVASGAQPEADAMSGLAAVQVLEAANTSLRSGSPVTLPQLPPAESTVENLLEVS
jgi:predicted dehydrogenase